MKIERSARLVQRLQEEGENTIRFFENIAPDQWEYTVYTDGARWQVREVLMHFVSSERGVSRLVELVVGGAEGVPEDFKLDQYNEKKVAQLKGVDHPSLILEFASLRARTVSMVEGLSDEDLDRSGRHPFLGMARVEDMLKLMYRHNQIHQRELRKVLSQTPS